MKTRLTALVLALLLSCSAYSSLTYQADKARTIYVSGAIMEPMGAQIMSLALMALDGREPITIVIDSPGGIVDFGQEFIDAMAKLKSRDVELVCVAKEAQSMGMAIFNACTTRYAVKDSVLMWHSVWTSARKLNWEDAEEVAKRLKKADEQVLSPIEHELCLTHEEFETSRKAEKGWSGPELSSKCPEYVKVVDSLENIEFPSRELDIGAILRKLVGPQPGSVQ